ncbi:hypothetical protein QWY31_10195 [Cytophagales bacterium LB-30]|uniref:Uncharacterized protein n=1 Tax=Shiella aurantiaca TaxID=3058365 RepID=A0ABT8F7E8_9BACT|nr:hypothetical protein [Shiella aurantiaca]MDN4165876.1 hypothetical protein [Shiella aurantiaca]
MKKLIPLLLIAVGCINSTFAQTNGYIIKDSTIVSGRISYNIDQPNIVTLSKGEEIIINYSILEVKEFKLANGKHFVRKNIELNGLNTNVFLEKIIEDTYSLYYLPSRKNYFLESGGTIEKIESKNQLIELFNKEYPSLQMPNPTLNARGLKKFIVNLNYPDSTININYSKDFNEKTKVLLVNKLQAELGFNHNQIQTPLPNRYNNETFNLKTDALSPSFGISLYYSPISPTILLKTTTRINHSVFNYSWYLNEDNQLSPDSELSIFEEYVFRTINISLLTGPSKFFPLKNGNINFTIQGGLSYLNDYHSNKWITRLTENENLSYEAPTSHISSLTYGFDISIGYTRNLTPKRLCSLHANMSHFISGNGFKNKLLGITISMNL